MAFYVSTPGASRAKQSAYLIARIKQCQARIRAGFPLEMRLDRVALHSVNA